MNNSKWLVVSAFSVLAGLGLAHGVSADADGECAGKLGKLEKLDTNADGVVTTKEFESHLLERWTTSDGNKDGKVTADEFKAQFSAHKAERFAKHDANKNGVLEQGELDRMPAQLFAKLDADKSGTLTQEELSSLRKGHGPKHEGGERKLPGDENGDGTVTKAEATSGVAKLSKALDKNSDGKLSKDELKKGHHGRGHGFGHHHGHQQADSDAG